MKKLLIIPMLLFAVLSSNAQDLKRGNQRLKQRMMMQKTPEQRAEMKSKIMTEQLSLTKEQQEEVYQLSLEQAKKNQTVAQVMKGVKEDNEKNQQKIEGLLTPEQQKKWTELKSRPTRSRKRNINTNKRDFKRKPNMIKKPDSTQSRKPADKISSSKKK